MQTYMCSGSLQDIQHLLAWRQSFHDSTTGVHANVKICTGLSMAHNEYQVQQHSSTALCCCPMWGGAPGTPCLPSDLAPHGSVRFSRCPPVACTHWPPRCSSAAWWHVSPSSVTRGTRYFATNDGAAQATSASCAACDPHSPTAALHLERRTAPTNSA